MTRTPRDGGGPRREGDRPPREAGRTPHQAGRTPREALALLEERAPPGHVEAAGRQVYLDIGRALSGRLDPGARVLDLGFGPCDEAELLRLMGHEVVEIGGVPEDDPPAGPFDLVVLEGVLERLAESPRTLLNDLLAELEAGGLVLVLAANAVSFWRWLMDLLGRRDDPSFSEYFWYPSTWRGHVREYTRGDLEALTELMGLERLELRPCHHKLHRLPGWARGLIRILGALGPGRRDTWLLVARKPQGWKPVKAPGFF